MSQKSDPSSDDLGLLAYGSSGRWDIAVDEALHRDEWWMEIEGRQTYLTFQLDDLGGIPQVLRFLQAGPPPKQTPGRHEGEEDGGTIIVGRFGADPVSLLWDNEDFQRCFLVIIAKGGSALRLSLEADDIPMFIEALSRVVAQLPPVAGE